MAVGTVCAIKECGGRHGRRTPQSAIFRAPATVPPTAHPAVCRQRGVPQCASHPRRPSVAAAALAFCSYRAAQRAAVRQGMHTHVRQRRGAPDDGGRAGPYRRRHQSRPAGGHADVPRERFVPPALAPQAYFDGDLAIGDGRRAAQADGSRQAHPGGAGARRRSCARCRLRHRLFLGRPWRGSRVRSSRSKRMRRWRARRRRRLPPTGAAQVTVAIGPLIGGLAGRRAL